MQPNSDKPVFSNKAYDVLKFISLVVLPGLGALYFGLAQIWGLPKAEEVIGTITVIDTFMGVVLGISTSKYNKSDAKYAGEIEVEETPKGKKIYSLKLNSDPEELDTLDTVVFKIKTN